MTLTKDRIEALASALCARELVPVQEILAMRDLALRALPDPEREKRIEAWRKRVWEVHDDGDISVNLGYEELVQAVALMRSAPASDDMRALRERVVELGKTHGGISTAWMVDEIDRLLSDTNGDPDPRDAEITALRTHLATVERERDEAHNSKRMGEEIMDEAVELAIKHVPTTGRWLRGGIPSSMRQLVKERDALRASLAKPAQPVIGTPRLTLLTERDALAKELAEAKERIAALTGADLADARVPILTSYRCDFCGHDYYDTAMCCASRREYLALHKKPAAPAADAELDAAVEAMTDCTNASTVRDCIALLAKRVRGGTKP